MNELLKQLNDIKYSNMFLFAVSGTALVGIGILMIYTFKYSLFVSLSTGKLILLSLGLTSPFFSVNTIFGYIEFKPKPSEVENLSEEERYKKEERFQYGVLVAGSVLTCLVLGISVIMVFLSDKKYLRDVILSACALETLFILGMILDTVRNKLFESIKETFSKITSRKC